MCIHVVHLRYLRLSVHPSPVRKFDLSSLLWFIPPLSVKTSLLVFPIHQQLTANLLSSGCPAPLHVLSIASLRIRWIRCLAKSPSAAVNRQMGVSPTPSPSMHAHTRSRTHTSLSVARPGHSITERYRIQTDVYLRL